MLCSYVAGICTASLSPAVSQLQSARFCVHQHPCIVLSAPPTLFSMFRLSHGGAYLQRATRQLLGLLYIMLSVSVACQTMRRAASALNVLWSIQHWGNWRRREGKGNEVWVYMWKIVEWFPLHIVRLSYKLRLHKIMGVGGIGYRFWGGFSKGPGK